MRIGAFVPVLGPSPLTTVLFAPLGLAVAAARMKSSCLIRVLRETL